MLDKFQQIALSMRFLLFPSMLVGSICLVGMAIILMSASSDEFEQYLRPSLLGFVWAATIYAFIATFRTIPDKAGEPQRLTGKIKHRISRGWYWFIAVVFIGTMVAALIFTGRLISIWLKAA